MSTPPSERKELLDAFLLRAGYEYGWENLESQARRMVRHAVDELSAAERAAWDPHAEHWQAISKAAEAIGLSEACTPEQSREFCCAIDRLSAALMGEPQAVPVEQLMELADAYAQECRDFGHLDNSKARAALETALRQLSL